MLHFARLNLFPSPSRLVSQCHSEALAEESAKRSERSEESNPAGVPSLRSGQAFTLFRMTSVSYFIIARQSPRKERVRVRVRAGNTTNFGLHTRSPSAF